MEESLEVLHQGLQATCYMVSVTYFGCSLVSNTALTDSSPFAELEGLVRRDDSLIARTESWAINELD